MNKRQRNFDKNRNMATIEQLTDQVTLLTQKIAEQENRLREVNVTRFELTADQIIRNFNGIPPFSGEDSFRLKSFLTTVKDVESLCGERNEHLKCYCLKKIINQKIIGSARNVILEIPEQQRTWETVVELLIQKFRPKHTIHQLLFQAKEIKVFNLKDLFNKINSIKSQTSEICDFENKEDFVYESVEQELVQILKSKLTPIMQIQIKSEKNLFELENEFCQNEIYFSSEIIKNEFRINKMFTSNDNGNNIHKQNNSSKFQNNDNIRFNKNNSNTNFSQNTNNNIQQNNYRQRQTNTNNNQHRPQQSNYYNNSQTQQNNYRPRQNSNYTNNQPRQSYFNNSYRQQNPNNYNNNTPRPQQSNNTYQQQPQNNYQNREQNNQSLPMEIDMINTPGLNEDVNFIN